MRKVSITVDVERDCPPKLQTFLGIKRGLPKLLELFRREEIPATFFVTAEIAEFFPSMIEDIVDEGHELGCHGMFHERFDLLDYKRASYAISKATNILNSFGEVTSFRAPYLKFPESYLSILNENGYRIDSSVATYKPPFFFKKRKVNGIVRIPVSVTSSFLRLPYSLVSSLLSCVKRPVLFIHPWEFIDMSSMPIRFDCRLGTGNSALENLERLIRYFKHKDYKFVPIKEM